MLGHQLLSSLRTQHDVRVTLHRPLAAYREFELFSSSNSIDGVDAGETRQLAAVIASAAPQAVINCVGIVKQRREAKSPIPSLEINALLPHRLLEICRTNGARLVHLSTDCVFSGRKGGYLESDEPDPVDLYGRTKLLGEIEDAPGLTLRTSIIGLELTRKAGLVEWFLAQRGVVRGFRRAIYTGLTTLEMARLLSRILTHHADLHGLWHVASAPISKYDLLVALSTELGRTDVEIVADDTFECDRSLNAERFFGATGYRPPAWRDMLTELADEIRRAGGTGVRSANIPESSKEE